MFFFSYSYRKREHFPALSSVIPDSKLPVSTTSYFLSYYETQRVPISLRFFSYHCSAFLISKTALRFRNNIEKSDEITDPDCVFPKCIRCEQVEGASWSCAL